MNDLEQNKKKYGNKTLKEKKNVDYSAHLLNHRYNMGYLLKSPRNTEWVNFMIKENEKRETWIGNLNVTKLMLILHRVFQIACLVFLFLNNYYIRKKNDKVELELNYDVITFKFDRSNVDIRIPIAVIEIKCVRKSKQVSNTA